MSDNRPSADEIIGALQSHPDLAMEVLGKLSAETDLLSALMARENVRAAGRVAQAKLRRLEMEAVLAETDGLAVCQAWTESERGWGQRPDGYTVHRDFAERDRFIESYNARLPAEIPESYSFADGYPYLVDTGADLYAKLETSGTVWGPGSTGPEPASAYDFDGRTWRTKK
jgi:hypothetical protein